MSTVRENAVATATTKAVTFGTVYFPSRSSDRVYETRVFADGRLSCNCPGWVYRVAADGSRSCRHTKAVEADTAEVLA